MPSFKCNGDLPPSLGEKEEVPVNVPREYQENPSKIFFALTGIGKQNVSFHKCHTLIRPLTVKGALHRYVLSSEQYQASVILEIEEIYQLLLHAYYT